MKINCEVIKDLLPSYIDGLTSPQSDTLIREHLKECPECREYLEEMTKEMKSSKEIPLNKKAIKPFRKLKKRIWYAVGGTILICALLFGIGFWYYGHTWTASSSDVTMNVDAQGGIATLQFSPKSKGTILQVETLEDQSNTLIITEKRKTPFEKAYQTSAYYGLTFLDENTIMGLNGESFSFSSEDTLTIQYQDTSQTLSLSELAQKALENPPAQSEDVEITYTKDDQGHVTLIFSATLLGVSLKVEEQGTDEILIRQYYDSLADPSESADSYTLTFADEDTLLLSDGSRRELTGEETLTIQYEDQTQEISFKDLWSGEGLK